MKCYEPKIIGRNPCCYQFWCLKCLWLQGLLSLYCVIKRIDTGTLLDYSYPYGGCLVCGAKMASNFTKSTCAEIWENANGNEKPSKNSFSPSINTYKKLWNDFSQ